MVAVLAALPAAASAQFPYAAGDVHDYTTYKLAPTAPRPNDLSGKLSWMYASTPTPGSPLIADKRELGGVRGAWVVDADGTAPQAWATTTGRPDVKIAVLDSGIQWNDLGKPMNDVRLKTWINPGETPLPQADRTTSTDTTLVPDCAPLRAREGVRDLNNDGVFNILDYACDSRVDPDPKNGVGPKVGGQPLLDPEDLIIAFSNGTDSDHNGYVDDIAGWDFLDDDNDPFDDVQYSHGSGEIRDSVGEANNGDDLGTCPNCMAVPLRVGTSFIADVNRFALAAAYATDNGVDVIQEALGTLNKSTVAADAIKYAYDHGTTVIASAADEAAQHHNWPSSYPYSIVVNSVTHTDTSPVDSSYLQFNGCTNFSSRVTLAIPSVSCSSDATGRGAGMAGLIYSAALNAKEQGKLDPHPDCRRVDGTRCVITPNEVRQVMASGTWDGVQAADDVDFAQDPATGQDTEPACAGNPIPGCTDPFYPVTASAPRVTAPTPYPARRGHDQFYGYGRVNMARTVDEVDPASGNAHIPPEVEVTSPDWFATVDPSKPSLDVSGRVWDRGQQYTCKLYVAPGSYPKDTPSTAGGDFVQIPNGLCDGTTVRTDAIDGLISQVDMKALKALYSSNANDFTGPEGGTSGQTPNPGNNVGRPDSEPYGFVVKVVATTVGSTPTMTGTDRRQAYLHRDVDMLPGFPKQIQGDIEASPVLADVDGDNKNELIIANSDGWVHAYRRDGSEVPGWPFHTDEIPDHPDSPAISNGGVGRVYGAVLATPAVGDLEHDGTLDVVVADMEGKVYVIDGATGTLERKMHTNPAFSGAPLHPFENVRGVGPDGKFDPALAVLDRMQHGFIGAPVLADLDQNDGGKLEIIAAALDRHVYAWNDDGSAVPGWPMVVVDRSKLRSQQPQFSPVTEVPYFDLTKVPTGGDITYDQGAIVDTPAVGDLDGDGKPDVIVGTNENYSNGDPGETFNGGGVNTATYQVLGAALKLANGRLYAIRNTGDPDGDPNTDPNAYLPGWPFRVGILEQGILPLVGEGITGSPVIGTVPCQGVTTARRVGVIPMAGIPYVVDKNGQSCYGRDPQGHDIGLNTEGGSASDQPVLAAFGHPAFANLAGGVSFLAPVAGVERAADAVLPEYQGGQDYLAAWDLQQPQGSFKAGWPSTTNDLQFLTGPSVADFDPTPGEEVVEGSASDDFQGITSAGTKVAGWPKLSGDWDVANPAIGSFGQLETDKNATRVVIDGTRNGRLDAYDTHAAPCGAASWPEFHHDPRNTGDLDRDAIDPGVPMGTAIADGNKLTFASPGDDLLCGTPKGYDVRTSDSPITPANFADALPVPNKGDAVAAGSTATLQMPPAGLLRYVAVRAVDEQGNVGLPAVVETTAAQRQGPQTSQDQTPTQQQAPGSQTPSSGGVLVDRHGCLPRKMRFKSRGLGAIRLGDTWSRTLLHVGRPPKTNKAKTVWTYCVRGSRGKVALVFVKGHIRLVASTARGHEAIGHAGPGDKISKIHRTYPGSKPFGRGIFFTRRSSRIVFVVHHGRVRVTAVVDRRAIKNPRLFRKYLKLAHP